MREACLHNNTSFVHFLDSQGINEMDTLEFLWR